MTRLEQEIFSPDIEDFSESDDIFNRSIEGERRGNINKEIAELHLKKPKYRPINKIPKPDGLMQRLRDMKLKRANQGCAYAKDEKSYDQEKKIKVLQHTIFRRRLLINFELVDDPIYQQINRHHFLVLPLEYKKFIEQHSDYDFVSDLPAQQPSKNYFVHFGKLLKASRAV